MFENDDQRMAHYQEHSLDLEQQNKKRLLLVGAEQDKIGHDNAALLERATPTTPVWDATAPQEGIQELRLREGQGPMRISMLEPPTEAKKYPHGGEWTRLFGVEYGFNH